eukprot:2189526-Lingulodinium_polyedra.AAC.1
MAYLDEACPNKPPDTRQTLGEKMANAIQTLRIGVVENKEGILDGLRDGRMLVALTPSRNTARILQYASTTSAGLTHHWPRH